MSILNKVKPVVEKFKKEHPEAGKVSYTGSDRTAEKELGFILERPTQYPVILKAYCAKFKAKALPSPKEITPEQTKWCLDFINGLAGKAGAYAHVGGKAQDLGISGVELETRQALADALTKAGFKILNEKVQGTQSKYGVPLAQANVLHVYVD